MEIKKIKLENIDKEFEFVNRSFSNRVGFKHESTLLINGREYAKCSVQYYNRTWECYTYQTSMIRTVESLIAEIVDNLLIRYKEENGIGRLTKQKREIFETEIRDKDEFYNELVALKEKLKDRNSAFLY